MVVCDVLLCCHALFLWAAIVLLSNIFGSSKRLQDTNVGRLGWLVDCAALSFYSHG